MSFASMLVHQGQVYRRRVGQDRFGQPHVEKGDYLLQGSPFACRLTQGRGAEQMTERTIDVVNVSYRLAMLAGQDIKEADRVTVTSADGKTLVEDANVTHVRPITGGGGKEHHREAALTVIRPGTTSF